MVSVAAVCGARTGILRAGRVLQAVHEHEVIRGQPGAVWSCRWWLGPFWGRARGGGLGCLAGGLGAEVCLA